jgi:hypothetical protein
MRLGLRSLDNRLRMDKRIGELGHNEPNVTSLSRCPYDILGGASVAVIWPEYTYPPFSPMLRDAEDVQRHRSAYVSSFRSIEALLMKPHSILGAATRIGDSLTFFAENMASASRCTQITNLYNIRKTGPPVRCSPVRQDSIPRISALTRSGNSKENRGAPELGRGALTSC